MWCGDATMLLSMLIYFRPPSLVRILSNPCFMLRFTCFLPQIISLLSSTVSCKRCANEGCVGVCVWLHGWHSGVLGLAREIMLARNLMCQPDARCQLPVWLPVLQGTGELRSADNFWVKSYNRYCNLTVYPAWHMRNGFEILSAMSRLKFASTTRDSLSRMSLEERTNGEKCFHWSWQCWPCLSLLVVSHRYRSAVIG